MEVLAVLVVLSLVVGLAGYFILMVFFPEWVGITGKVAKRNMKDHSGGQSEQGDTSLEE